MLPVAVSSAAATSSSIVITAGHPAPNLTQCGLPGLATIPYGVHMCHFYKARADLVATLVPFFAAGLRNNERCIWITAEPLDAAAAESELLDAGVDVDSAIRNGSLVIRDYSNWYSESEALEGCDVAGRWLEEERRALEDGYSGLRITGNTSFLRPEGWDGFMEYEGLLKEAFASRRIVALCSYPSSQCGAAEVLDVIRRHGITIERPDEGWRILTSPWKQTRG